MSGWKDAIEVQYDLFKFWRSPLGGRYGEMYVQDKTVTAPLRHGLDPIPNGAQFIQGQHRLADIEASKFLLADPVYVSEEMFEIAEAASESFVPEPLQETDLLSSTAFVLLPRPFVTQDINDKATAWRAFGWSPCQSPDGKLGIHLSTYTSREDAALDDYPIDKALPWQPLHIQPWWFGDDLPEVELGAAWWVKCQSLLRLMMQHIAVREERQAPRASRRRWQRERPEDERERYVVVVKLRRPKHAPANERSVEWQQRWIVAGHWRNQWFPSLQIHRQIWISDHVKGPDDKPLVIRKARAFELVR